MTTMEEWRHARTHTITSGTVISYETLTSALCAHGARCGLYSGVRRGGSKDSLLHTVCLPPQAWCTAPLMYTLPTSLLCFSEHFKSKEEHAA